MKKIEDKIIKILKDRAKIIVEEQSDFNNALKMFEELQNRGIIKKRESILPSINDIKQNSVNNLVVNS